jgi:hypothetical protein
MLKVVTGTKRTGPNVLCAKGEKIARKRKIYETSSKRS